MNSDTCEIQAMTVQQYIYSDDKTIIASLILSQGIKLTISDFSGLLSVEALEEEEEAVGFAGGNSFYGCTLNGKIFEFEMSISGSGGDSTATFKMDLDKGRNKDYLRELFKLKMYDNAETETQYSYDKDSSDLNLTVTTCKHN